MNEPSDVPLECNTVEHEPPVLWTGSQKASLRASFIEPTFRNSVVNDVTLSFGWHAISYVFSKLRGKFVMNERENRYIPKTASIGINVKNGRTKSAKIGMNVKTGMNVIIALYCSGACLIKTLNESKRRTLCTPLTYLA